MRAIHRGHRRRQCGHPRPKPLAHHHARLEPRQAASLHGGRDAQYPDNLARLGENELPSAVGKRRLRSLLRTGCEALGMGTAGLLTRQGHSSSSYISIMDSQGDMLVAMSDSAHPHRDGRGFVRERMDLLNGAELVVCDGNLSASALGLSHRPLRRALCVDPVSTTWARKWCPFSAGSIRSSPTAWKWRLLAGMPIADDADLEEACRRVLAAGVRRVFVSLGADGIY